MTISEINQGVAVLKAKKALLIQHKSDFMAKLSAINSACSIKMPGRDYQDKQRERNLVVGELMELEKKLSAIGSEIATLAATPPDDKKVDVSAQRPIVQELVELRDYYEAFAQDHTRVSSTRLMASEFTSKLTTVIRHAMAHAK